MKRKIFSIVLAVVFMMTSGVTVFAETSEDKVFNKEALKEADVLAEYETLEYTMTALEVDGQYVTIADYGSYYEVSRRPVDSYVITLEKYDSDGNIISSEICDYSYLEEELANEEEMEIEPYAIGDYQRTISNYEYEIDGGAGNRYEIWVCIRRENEKVRPVHDTTSALFERLDHWRTLVNYIDQYEIDLGVSAGQTLAQTVIEVYFLKSPTAAVTLLTGIGEAIDIFGNYDETIQTADRVFDRL